MFCQQLPHAPSFWRSTVKQPSSRPERSGVEGPPHFAVACSCSSFWRSTVKQPSSRPERSGVEGPPHFAVACSCSSFWRSPGVVILAKPESPYLPLFVLSRPSGAAATGVVILAQPESPYCLCCAAAPTGGPMQAAPNQSFTSNSHRINLLPKPPRAKSSFSPITLMS
jgi:hypothetical protein